MYGSYNRIFVALESAGFLILPDDYDIAHDDDDDDDDDDGQMDYSSFHPCPDRYVKGCLKMNISVKTKIETLLLDNKELQESTLPAVDVHYLYLIDNLCKLLESCDPGVFIDKCASLMASYNYNIPLFSDEVLKVFSEYHNVPVMLRYLMCYCTWCDLSVVAKLLETCDYPEGVRLLQQFKHMIDFTKTIMEYPISNVDSSMVLPQNISYAMMVTKYESVNCPLSLKHIEMIKSLITERCGITFISCQFLAITNDFQDFHWLIPERIVQLIVDKVEENSSYFHHSGLKELSIYPYANSRNLFITDLSTDSSSGKVR